MNDFSLDFVPDTRSSVTIIKAKYLKPENCTGRKVYVLLADRCVRFYPEVQIEISNPCYNGTVMALELKNPVNSLVI